MKAITTEQILANNPQIDKGTLEQSRELLQQIRKTGLKKHRRTLISPYVRRISRVKSRNTRMMRTSRLHR